jgi:hypothetical protein
LGKGYYEQYKVQASLPDHGIPFLEVGGGDTLFESDLIRKRWRQHGSASSRLVKEQRFSCL